MRAWRPAVRRNQRLRLRRRLPPADEDRRRLVVVVRPQLVAAADVERLAGMATAEGRRPAAAPRRRAG